jgi:nucleoside-diphosphate-sugar epimerase
MSRNTAILVTGAAGFIGWKVCEFLLSHPELLPDTIGKDLTVVGVDNINDYYDIRLKQWRLEQLQNLESNNTRYVFFEEDIENLVALRGLFEKYKFAAVVNLAARAGVRYSLENPFIYYTTNVMGNLNLLECCREFAVKKFILASSSSLYAGQEMPFKEDLPVNEPISPYAASKKSGEVTCYAYHHLYNIDVTILRYFTVYGPASRPDMAPLRFISWIFQQKPVVMYGDGSQSRDFTYIDDIARGTLLALKPLGFKIINLGGDKPYRLVDFLHVIEEKTGKKAKLTYKPFHPADMKATWADITKAKRLLDWQPTVQLEKGIEIAVEWFIENRSWTAQINLS